MKKISPQKATANRRRAYARLGALESISAIAYCTDDSTSLHTLPPEAPDQTTLESPTCHALTTTAPGK